MQLSVSNSQLIVNERILSSCCGLCTLVTRLLCRGGVYKSVGKAALPIGESGGPFRASAAGAWFVARSRESRENLLFFHSMRSGSARADLSPTMRRRVSGTGGAGSQLGRQPKHLIFTQYESASAACADSLLIAAFPCLVIERRRTGLRSQPVARNVEVSHGHLWQCL
jgi:hypothetical protein